MKRIALLFFVVVAAGLGLAILVLPGSVSAVTLARDLDRQIGPVVSDVTTFCKRRQSSWRCDVPDDSGGSSGYRVTIDDDACWKARLVDPGAEPLPGMADGCLHLLELPRLRLFASPAVDAR